MAKYPKSELTLALDGEVTPQSLAKALEAFACLLQTLTQESAPGVRLEWVVTDLSAGSSIATVQCRALDKADEAWIPRVIEGGRRFADQMERNVLIPDRSPTLRQVEESFRDLVSPRLIRVRLETPDQDFVLAGPSRQTFGEPPRRVAFGAVRGRVQAMSNRGSLRFTIYDVNDDKAVSCYLPESADSEELMLGLWGSVVSVEGFVSRDPLTGRPLSVRDIAAVSPVAGTSWRDAVGLAPGFLGTERSEDVVRKTRDE